MAKNRLLASSFQQNRHFNRYFLTSRNQPRCYNERYLAEWTPIGRKENNHKAIIKQQLTNPEGCAEKIFRIGVASRRRGHLQFGGGSAVFFSHGGRRQQLRGTHWVEHKYFCNRREGNGL